MKLIFCPDCKDLFRLYPDDLLYCKCKKSWGQYDHRGRIGCFGGKSVPIGMENSSLLRAVRSRDILEIRDIHTFVIPFISNRIKEME